ncbi:hypothetical protein [Streptomyces erythrochromogenes]|uniref:hypothetical protein n=1 Tax=Streptomyces erythrochromogenes TaxID=285574 RepID=UPI0037D21F98
MSIRDDVMVIINGARALGLDVSPADVVWDGGDGPTIDGMPVDEWCAAMLME